MSLFASRTPTLGIGSLPRVDLLPPSESRRRAMLARARTWVIIGIAALAVAAIAVAGAFTFHMAAGLRLAAEQTRTQDLLVGVAELSDVSQALALRRQLETMRTEAMAGDLAWVPVLRLVADRLPDGIAITGYALDAGPAPTAGADPASATGVSGTLTFTSPAPIDFVQATRDLRAAPGMRDADVETLTSAEGLFTYTVRVDIDQSVYSGAYGPRGDAE